MREVVLITLHSSTTGRKLKHELLDGGVKVHEITMNHLDHELRKQVITSVLQRNDDGVDAILSRNVNRKYPDHDIEEMSLSEFIDFAANDVTILRAPMLINEYNELIIGKSSAYTPKDYTGRI